MPDHGGADQAFQVATPQAPQRKLPEHLAVVTEYTDLPENLAQHDQPALDIGPALLFRAHWRLQLVGIGEIALILVTRVQFLGLIGDLHAFSPRSENLIVWQQEIDVRIPAFVVDQAIFTFQSIPQRGLWKRLQEIDRQQENLRVLYKGEQCFASFRLIGIETHDDAGDHLHAVRVDGMNALENGDHHIVVLVHGLQRVGIRRFDAAEDRDKESLAHLLENLRPLGDIERSLAGQANHVAGSFLPLNQIRHQTNPLLPLPPQISVPERH